MKICFATHNKNKLSELQKLVPEAITLVSLDDIGITEDIPETGETLEENSIIKAQYVWQKEKIACFADDTGLEIAALNGEPGVYSARYAGEARDDHANMDLVLSKLANETNRVACFKTVITYINDTGDQLQFTGTSCGTIIKEKIGDEGFGYDPIFTPENETRTFAQMSKDEKNAISHRGRAFAKLIEHLTNQS